MDNIQDVYGCTLPTTGGELHAHTRSCSTTLGGGFTDAYEFGDADEDTSDIKVAYLDGDEFPEVITSSGREHLRVYRGTAQAAQDCRLLCHHARDVSGGKSHRRGARAAAHPAVAAAAARGGLATAPPPPPPPVTTDSPQPPPPPPPPPPSPTPPPIGWNTCYNDCKTTCVSAKCPTSDSGSCGVGPDGSCHKLCSHKCWVDTTYSWENDGGSALYDTENARDNSWRDWVSGEECWYACVAAYQYNYANWGKSFRPGSLTYTVGSGCLSTGSCNHAHGGMTTCQDCPFMNANDWMAASSYCAAACTSCTMLYGDDVGEDICRRNGGGPGTCSGTDFFIAKDLMTQWYQWQRFHYPTCRHQLYITDPLCNTYDAGNVPQATIQKVQCDGNADCQSFDAPQQFATVLATDIDVFVPQGLQCSSSSRCTFHEDPSRRMEEVGGNAMEAQAPPLVAPQRRLLTGNDDEPLPQRRALNAYSRFPGDARDSRLLPNVQQIFVRDFDE